MNLQQIKAYSIFEADKHVDNIAGYEKSESIRRMIKSTFIRGFGAALRLTPEEFMEAKKLLQDHIDIKPPGQNEP